MSANDGVAYPSREDGVGPDSSSARIVAAIGGSLNAELAGVLAHETNHGILERLHGAPTTASQELGFEIRAYTTQGIVHQGLDNQNSAGGYWWNGRLNGANILRGALDSLAVWCAQPGARGCR